MDNGLILIIENETPLRADELGELFTAFARDYNALTRRTLVVVRFEQGSTIIEWADFAFSHAKEAAEVIKAAKGLTDLVAALKSLFGGEKEQKKAASSRSRRKAPAERAGNQHFGRLFRVSQVYIAVATRVLENADRARQKLLHSLPFSGRVC
jgi:hypothetical protein